MNVIFLAAGKSSRIYKVLRKPKCLLDFRGISLIEKLIKNFSFSKNIKLNIVVGFKSSMIKNKLKRYIKSTTPTPISTITNPIAPKAPDTIVSTTKPTNLQANNTVQKLLNNYSSDFETKLMAYGVLFSFIISFFTLKLFIQLGESFSFTPFVIYRMFLGMVLLALAYI